MVARSVLVIGDSLFADALKQTLADNSVAIVGCVATLAAALPLLRATCPDAVIIAHAGADSAPPTVLGQILAAYPDLPIIYANLNTNVVRVVASHQLGPRSADLLAAIAAIPKRS